MTWIYSLFSGPSGFSANSRAEDVTNGIDGTGLTAIVTGASSGIGLETASVLAMRGVHVIMAVRNLEVGQKVKAGICAKTPNAKLDVMELDLSSQASVRKFAADYIAKDLPLNILILNAGIMSPPFTLSQDNIELQFATNHIGHFLLTNLLLDTMKKTSTKSQKEGRIVVVSSDLHKMSYPEGIRFDKINDEKSYSAFYAYGQSKLANALHAKELARRLQEERANVTVNSLHPGVIKTNLTRNQGIVVSFFSRLALSFLKNIPQGAATSCYVALHPQVKGVSGEYFADSNISKAGKFVDDPEMAKKLWEFSLNLTQLK
ncbi:putative very-long-chain 3-oxoacyl-CoA reductase [Helianthus annuus]|uniref:Putative glucose/ribitol dehydrogenase n=1 Tax=Helianthus annuus TaxID=4232 RepID=A0A251V097_HELAN|nr:short-chain dehydrogenase TIC 32, chloroplastic [Helianthus annuus]KAF5818998.1 putative very-long-chain 3-oxoacyl-CoA reductase [Helianthus annuus]